MHHVDEACRGRLSAEMSPRLCERLGATESECRAKGTRRAIPARRRTQRSTARHINLTNSPSWHRP